MAIERKARSDMSIEDILESIRNVINERSNSSQSYYTNEGDISSDSDSSSEYEDENELHLTDIKVDAECNALGKTHDEAYNKAIEESIISEKASRHTRAILEDFAQTAESLGKNIHYSATEGVAESKALEKFLENMLKPLMKEWLDINLPMIVKQIVTEEIKRLVSNMNRT